MNNLFPFPLILTRFVTFFIFASRFCEDGATAGMAVGGLPMQEGLQRNRPSKRSLPRSLQIHPNPVLPTDGTADTLSHKQVPHPESSQDHQGNSSS